MRVRWAYTVPVPVDAAFDYYRDPLRAFLVGARGYRVVGDGFLRGEAVRVQGPSPERDWIVELDGIDPPRRIAVRVWPNGHEDRSLWWTHEFTSTPDGGAHVAVSVEGKAGAKAELFFALMRPFEALARRRWTRRETAAVVASYRARETSRA